LQVAPSTIHALIREKDPVKRIPYVRVGKSYRFFASELSRHFNMNIDILKEPTNV